MNEKIYMHRHLLSHVFIQFLAHNNALDAFLTSMLNLNERRSEERETQLSDGVLDNMHEPIMWISWSNNEIEETHWQEMHHQWYEVAEHAVAILNMEEDMT